MVFVINFVPLRIQSSVPIFTWEWDHWREQEIIALSPFWLSFFSTKSPLSPTFPFSSLPNSVNLFLCSGLWRTLRELIKLFLFNGKVLPGGSESKESTFNAGDPGWIPGLGRFPAAAAKSLQSCPALCDSRDRSPPSSLILGILQARTLEWVAISFSNAWKWKVKSEREVTQSCVTLSTRLLHPWDFPGNSAGVGCRCLLPGRFPRGGEMAIHSSILVWRILSLEEPGGLQFMWSQRVKHDWGTNTFTFKVM